MFNTAYWEELKRDIRRSLMAARLPEFRTNGSNGLPGWILTPLDMGREGLITQCYSFWRTTEGIELYKAREGDVEAALKRYAETLYISKLYTYLFDLRDCQIDDRVPFQLYIKRTPYL